MDNIEQATAAPGEVRNVAVPYNKQCWRLTGEGQERCHLHYGHVGDCDSTVVKADADAGVAGDERG